MTLTEHSTEHSRSERAGQPGQRRGQLSSSIPVGGGRYAGLYLLLGKSTQSRNEWALANPISQCNSVSRSFEKYEHHAGIRRLVQRGGSSRAASRY